jgi:hypothetical protein
MPTEVVQTFVFKDEKTEQAVVRPHVVAYGWIYVLFAALTALALYVIFTFPQGDI